MKKLITILVFFGLLLQTGSKLLIIANYYINKDYIAKNLCENRNRPERKCCGKCYLRKQLNKEEGNNSKQLPTKDKYETVVFLVQQKYILPELIYDHQNTFGVSSQNFYNYNFSAGIFHPPSVA